MIQIESVETASAGEHEKGSVKIEKEIKTLREKCNQAAQEATEIIQKVFAACGMTGRKNPVFMRACGT